MSAPANTSDLSPQPDPRQDRASGAATPPSRTAHLLFLVRKLIDYGFEVAATLRQRSNSNNLRVLTRPFGTTDLKLIFARITHGLRLAGALEERLMRRPVREEKKPVRKDKEPARTGEPSPRKPRGAQPAARRSHDDADARLAQMPTPEEIAAEIRRRPAGAVIADICRDLGVVFGHKLWRELTLAIIDHGGSIVRLSKDIFKRLRAGRPGLSASGDPVWPASDPPFSQACGTGPPDLG